MAIYNDGILMSSHHFNTLPACQQEITGRLDVFYKIEDKLEALPTLYSIDWVDLSRVSPDFLTKALAEAKLIHG